MSHRQPIATKRAGGSGAEVIVGRKEGDGAMTGARATHELFSVTSEQRGHAAHLSLFGEIDMSTAPVLEGRLQAAESNGNTAIVVDLEQVTFLDACGLRAFLGAAERASQSGRSFAITRVPARVQRVLQITGTTHLLGADSLAFSPDRRGEPSIAAQALAGGSLDILGGGGTKGTVHAVR